MRTALLIGAMFISSMAFAEGSSHKIIFDESTTITDSQLGTLLEKSEVLRNLLHIEPKVSIEKIYSLEAGLIGQENVDFTSSFAQGRVEFDIINDDLSFDCAVSKLHSRRGIFFECKTYKGKEMINTYGPLFGLPLEP